MTAIANRVARIALEKMLEKAERCWAREVERECTLLFSESSFPEYLKMPLRVDKDAAHAELRYAEQEGAIALEWDQRAGFDGQIIRARLISADLLADVLERATAWKLYEHAQNQLRPWIDDPSVQAVLKRWRAGKQVRGLGANRVCDFVDARKIIDECKQLPSNEDVPIRRLSAALFADSKRIESLVPALDALTIESLDAPGRDTESVLNSLGLVKIPQPVLLAGNGTVELMDGRLISIPFPYIGLAPQSIKNVFSPDESSYLLTVENLTTFHELALRKAGDLRGIILYTAGMPSPALLRVYRICVDGLVTQTRARFHWGDIDLGGFRIAASLARANASPLRLWAMDSLEFPTTSARKTLTTEERREIVRIGNKWGWETIAQHASDDGRAIEQEAVALRIPF